MTKSKKKVMGRPPIGTELEKSQMLSLRLTSAEMSKVDKAAAKAKRTKSDWARTALLSAAN
jgi:hypothetical protein